MNVSNLLSIREEGGDQGLQKYLELKGLQEGAAKQLISFLQDQVSDRSALVGCLTQMGRKLYDLHEEGSEICFELGTMATLIIESVNAQVSINIAQIDGRLHENATCETVQEVNFDLQNNLHIQARSDQEYESNRALRVLEGWKRRRLKKIGKHFGREYNEDELARFRNPFADEIDVLRLFLPTEAATYFWQLERILDDNTIENYNDLLQEHCHIANIAQANLLAVAFEIPSVLEIGHSDEDTEGVCEQKWNELYKHKDKLQLFERRQVGESMTNTSHLSKQATNRVRVLYKHIDPKDGRDNISAYIRFSSHQLYKNYQRQLFLDRQFLCVPMFRTLDVPKISFGSEDQGQLLQIDPQDRPQQAPTKSALFFSRPHRNTSGSALFPHSYPEDLPACVYHVSGYIGYETHFLHIATSEMGDTGKLTCRLEYLTRLLDLLITTYHAGYIEYEALEDGDTKNELGENLTLLRDHIEIEMQTWEHLNESYKQRVVQNQTPEKFETWSQNLASIQENELEALAASIKSTPYEFHLISGCFYEVVRILDYLSKNATEENYIELQKDMYRYILYLINIADDSFPEDICANIRAIGIAIVSV